ncbi:dephospho-CoA kinase [Vagococcus fessus]|uniref:Dephospho-CoA kinase n=1 Tax=Vagococcus fessus TaxID=120370 RepID=A0A430ACZ7_9ENTE|nr:dephospho-CoA kinase [Vagococcus fessus]RSU05068.1 dephospho-CoA kinase [Vagococcus fessus]
MTFILGLTGGIATGKSTVSRYFSDQGYPVIDADLIAREVVEPGTLGLEKIVSVFGRSVLTQQGELDRQKLGQLVFSDILKRKKLDAVLDGEIRQAIVKAIEEYTLKKTALVIVDIPLLYEAGYESLMTKVMVVYVSEETQLKRLMERNSLTQEEAKQRMNSQLSIQIKKMRADFVIDNSGTKEETKLQVLDWLEKKGLNY